MINFDRTCEVEAVADQGAPTEEVGQAEPPVFILIFIPWSGKAT